MSLERCDDRILLSTFAVTSLGDSGPNTLRQAILDLNAATDPGQDLIDFEVAGTIQLTSGPLPTITHPVILDGTSAPGFGAKPGPVVAINNGGFAGLVFGPGSSGSTVRSLAIDGSGSDGLTLDAGNITVVGNIIGLGLDGATLEANAGNGILINPTSTNDTIGATSTVAPGSVISTASNVISGNGLNGIEVNGSSGNSIVANYIGADASGLLPRGNGGSGILLDNFAIQNAIGGAIAFHNAQGLVPASNLISANHGDGVLIDNDSSFNILAGNFIGTDITGNAPLGNAGDGVGMLNGSDGNVLLGTTASQSPFIYANIVGGNGGNGLRISNSDGNSTFANHFGLGVDNASRVGNAGDGALIEGTSTGTLFGGLIPLGNVCAANGGNGLEITDLASNTLVSNTFSGVAAFSEQTNLGNAGDGMLITSAGGGITIHTGNIVAENGRNGIEIGGDASGVQVYADLIGSNTDGTVAMPNHGDGVRIDGSAHDNSIGAPAVGPTSDSKVANAMNATRNIISGNLGNGVSVLGSAHDNQIVNSYIGLKTLGASPLPDGGSGVYLGEASSQTTVGGTAPGTANQIAFNGGSGVLVASGRGNAIRRNSIFNNQAKGIVLGPGANGNQPAPLLTHAKKVGALLGIGGNIQTAPRATYQVELFSNAIPQTTPSSGQTYLSTDTVTTNARGFARFRFYLSPSTASSVFFTATATSPADETSALSNPLRPSESLARSLDIGPPGR